MGREVRMVPANWKHPKYKDGSYRPLEDNFMERLAEWDRHKAKWDEGLVSSFTLDDSWVSRDETYDDYKSFEEYWGPRPDPVDYMPDWKPEERTHFMMYEDTTEGTPISPAFATAEELARWLVLNNASAFGPMGATYEQWLGMIRRGSSVSLVVSKDGVQPGTVLNEKSGDDA